MVNLYFLCQRGDAKFFLLLLHLVMSLITYSNCCISTLICKIYWQVCRNKHFVLKKITNILIKFVCLTLQKYPTIMKLYCLNLKVAIFSFKIKHLLRKMNLFLLFLSSQKLVLWTAIHYTGQPLKRSFWNKKRNY